MQQSAEKRNEKKQSALTGTRPLQLLALQEGRYQQSTAYADIRDNQFRVILWKKKRKTKNQ